MKTKLPKIFLDSCNPDETKRAKGLLGLVSGQTTNPTLVAKNPDVQKYLSTGKNFTEVDLLNKYRELVDEIGKEIAGPISVEVYADWQTTSVQMLRQAEEMCTWGKNIYIKFPTIPAGLEASNSFIKNGGKVNMTLIFDQVQLASAYVATKESSSTVFVSPFIGRWDDRGYDGIHLIKNAIKMYKHFHFLDNKKSNIEILCASIRNLDHLYACIWMGVDFVTISLDIIRAWIQDEQWVPDKNYRYDNHGLKSLVYEDLPLYEDFRRYEIIREEGSLLDEGIKKFVYDWNGLIEKV